jgi:hypothetical protein
MKVKVMNVYWEMTDENLFLRTSTTSINDML